MTKPAVLFLCTHNAGRSQMALGFFNRLAGDRATAFSGGSEPADQINPAAVAVMAERGIDITTEHPKRWTDEMIETADVVVTMGCGDTCPFVPGRRYVDWALPDPAGQPVEAVRPIRDEIEDRVRRLLGELGIDPEQASSSRRAGDRSVASLRWLMQPMTWHPPRQRSRIGGRSSSARTRSSECCQRPSRLRGGHRRLVEAVLSAPVASRRVGNHSPVNGYFLTVPIQITRLDHRLFQITRVDRCPPVDYQPI